MKRTIIVTLLIIASASAVAGTPKGASAAAVEHSPKPTETKNTYAMIICGINKDPKERLANFFTSPKNKVVINLRRFSLIMPSSNRGRFFGDTD